MKRCRACNRNLSDANFRKVWTKGYGPYLNSYCRECERKKARASAKNVTPEKRQQYATNRQSRYYRRLEKAVEILGGVCVDCGSDQDLEFDHVEEGNSIPTIIMRRWSYVLTELSKCELRCAVCHAVKHGSGNRHNLPAQAR